MANLIRGTADDTVNAVLGALKVYENQFPGSSAEVYRQNPGAIRIRIIDDRFAGVSRSDRHDTTWDFLKQHVAEDALAEISMLLLLPPAEVKNSMTSWEFDDPIPSTL